MTNSKNRIEACLAAVVACEKCMADCILEGHKECIALTRDCADICALYARLEARNSIYAKDLRKLYGAVCLACAEECSKHASGRSSCAECAIVCRNCAQIDAVTSGTGI